VQAAHITGSASSQVNFPVTTNNNLPPFGGNTDAFIGLISTTSAAGNYLGFLGGGNLDQGTSIALDPNLDSSPTFVAGITQSAPFPNNPAQPPLQPGLSGPQDAFIALIGSRSDFVLNPDPPKANPSPATVGNQVTFTFVFQNSGPDPASNVIFSGTLPTSGFTFSSANASPGGACPSPVASKVTCSIGTVAAGANATVTVVLIPATGTTSLTVVPTLSANGGVFKAFTQGSVQINDFSIKADPPSVTITAGESTSFVVTLAPVPVNATYANAISVSQTGLPTASTGTFTSTSVTGLSLLGLGVGAGFRRRRWLAGMLLGLLAGLILLQSACGNSGSSTPPTGGTPAGTYPVTITGSSGSASHNTRVTLIVN
jgi:uncharacterized repeat protein (TIGR01451 family)